MRWLNEHRKYDIIIVPRREGGVIVQVIQRIINVPKNNFRQKESSNFFYFFNPPKQHCSGENANPLEIK